MCTLAAFINASERYPLLIAANRDEYYDRPTGPPTVVDGGAVLIAGRDLRAQGTWLGVRCRRDDFLVAGLLNRKLHEGAVCSAWPRSRGELCLTALRHKSVAAVRRGLAALEPEDYAPFNLFVADTSEGIVIDNRDGFRETVLEPGLSILTNSDLNDPRCPRLAGAFPKFEATQSLLRDGYGLDRILASLVETLSDHETPANPGGTGPLSRLCVHTDSYGTRSCSVIVRGPGEATRFFHAEGPPCESSLAEITVPRHHFSGTR